MLQRSEVFMSSRRRYSASTPTFHLVSIFLVTPAENHIPKSSFCACTPTGSNTIAIMAIIIFILSFIALCHLLISNNSEVLIFTWSSTVLASSPSGSS